MERSEIAREQLNTEVTFEPILSSIDTAPPLILNGANSLENLLNLRQVSSQRKREATSHLIKKLSMKQVISFKTPEEMAKFTQTFQDQQLLHDSFKFDFPRGLKSKEFFINFVSLAGISTKFLDLSAFEPNLTDFYSVFNWIYLKDYLFGSLVAHAQTKVQIEKFLLDKILFVHFPHLVVLGITEFKYREIQHRWIFHSKEERNSKFNSCQLDSLKSLYVTFKDNDNTKSFSPADPKCRFLSEEIMEISPNLKKIKMNFEPHLRVDTTVEQILETIVKFDLQVDHLSISTQNENLYENLLTPDFHWENFELVNIKRLSFKDTEFDCRFHQHRLELFNALLPLSRTLVDFSHTSIKSPCFDKTYWIVPTDDEFQARVLSTMTPPIFENLKILKLIIQFPPNYEIQVLNKLAKGSPLIENFTTSIISNRSDGLLPWKKLKKIFFNHIKIHWESEKEYLGFQTFIQTLAPSVKDLSIHVKCCEAQNRKGLVLAYPFFLWMGYNWRILDECQVSVNSRLKWKKGTLETHLGIETPNWLNDERRNFTLREISDYDLSLVLSLEVFMKTEGFMEFVNWLRSSFPKRTDFNQVVLNYMENIEDFKKLFTSQESPNLNAN